MQILSFLVHFGGCKVGSAGGKEAFFVKVRREK